MSGSDFLTTLQRRSTPVIRQAEASECGLACLAMVASYHGYDVDLPVLRHRFSTSLKGATLKQVMQVAEQLGFSSRPVRGEIEHLDQIALPAILHWDMNHYVVLVSISSSVRGRRYHIHDPARGQLAFKRNELSSHWTGVALEVRKSTTFQAKSERRTLSVTQLWSSITGLGKSLRQVFALSLILQLVGLAAPFYLQLAVDSSLPAGDGQLLLVMGLAFAGLAVIEFATSWLRSLVLVSLTNSLSFQITVNLFRHLLNLALPWFEKRHTGDIISRFGSTQPVTQLLSNGMVAAFIDGVLAVVTFALMVIYSPLLAFVALAALTLYLAVRLAFFKNLQLANVNMVNANAAEQSTFIESIRGIAAVKAFGQEGGRLRLWQRKKADAVNAAIRLGRLGAGFEATNRLLLSLERILFVGLAIKLAFGGTLTVGMIFAFQAYKQQFVDAGIRLIEQAMNYRILQMHLGRIADIALTRPEDSTSNSLSDLPSGPQPIELRNVYFRYGMGEPLVLAGANLKVEAGAMVALIGPSGGGKTTLMKIMMGLFDPVDGAVLVQGSPLARQSKSAFRRRIGSVAQGDSLYAGTLADNIAFFDPEMDMERVKEVARLAHIHSEIESMPLKYQTLVGDMGSVLSGGQKQRVLLARALYGRPTILFMDEGTANLDEHSEDLVLQSLTALDITRVVIAHRRKAIEAADSIFVVSQGHVQPVEHSSTTAGQ